MINVNDFKPGVTFLYDKEIFLVIESAHSKSGRGQAHVKAKVKNLKTGTTKMITFTGGDVVYPAIIEKRKAQYLYLEGQNYFFMDVETFDQISINENKLEWEKNFLVEGETISLRFYNEEVIGVELKPAVTLEVTYTEPGVRGNSANASLKPATLSTGYQVQVPLFINNNDKIIVSTIDGAYKSRA